jgi:hypothetical protein
MVDQVDSGEGISRSQWDAWQKEIAAIGVTNPLTNFETNNFGHIDLERSHPGGFSQFVTGRATLLSNLVRDPLAYSRALAAARRINAKAERLSNHFGIETLFLVGGLADFEGDGFDLKMPILMWPISLEKRGDDYELQKSGLPQVNPAFVDALEVCYGIKLNEIELLARQNESSDLVPVTVLNHLANLTGDKAKLDLKRILVIGNFTTAPTRMLRDFERVETPLLRELRGFRNAVSRRRGCNSGSYRRPGSSRSIFCRRDPAWLRLPADRFEHRWCVGKRGQKSLGDRTSSSNIKRTG